MSFFEAIAPDSPWAPLWVILMAALPVGEVRFSIPLAILHFKMGWGEAVVWSLLGNFGIVPILFWALPWGERLVRMVPVGGRLLDRLFARTQAKHSAKVEKYEELALMLFISVPIPGTGAWMGVLVAYLFGLPQRKAWPYCYAGVTIACFLVLAIVLVAEDAARRWFL